MNWLFGPKVYNATSNIYEVCRNPLEKKGIVQWHRLSGGKESNDSWEAYFLLALSIAFAKKLRMFQET